MANLVFYKAVADGSVGKLVFGFRPSGPEPGGAVVSVRAGAGFVTASVSLFNGTAWVSASAVVTG